MRHVLRECTPNTFSTTFPPLFPVTTSHYISTLNPSHLRYPFFFALFTRGKPLKDAFVRHCRTLLATGSSARSVWEQLFVNAAFFLEDTRNALFIETMPELRWFQTQREGLGIESLLYSFMQIAMCDEVCQWGLDETSLNGIPTLNQ